MNNETIGQRIARLRKEKGMTQAELAEKLNVTAQAVSKWENDQASPDIEMLLALSKIFDITVDDLLGVEKPKVSKGAKPNKKDLEKLVLRIVVDSDDGDKVNINLPLAIVKAFMNEDGEITILKDSKGLKGVDFKKIVALIEEGVIGELVSIEDKDGNKVHIAVE